MRRAIFAGAVVAPLLATLPVRASDGKSAYPFESLLDSEEPSPDGKSRRKEVIRKDHCERGSSFEGPYFDILGSGCAQTWEVRGDSTFSTSRIATERMELAGYYGVALPGYNPFGLVLRTDFGLESDTTTGLFSPQGPRLSLGVRSQSASNKEVIEAGIRVIFPWSGPHDGDPAMMGLALGATLAGGQADDSRWLAFHSLGYQVYLNIEQRLEFPWSSGVLILGTRYGVVTSLAPLSVQTWLGPEDGIIANAYLELFLAVPWWSLPGAGPSAVNLQVGLRGEGSLSSIWPGDASLPVALDPFLLWQPAPWISARVFGCGLALPAVALTGGGGVASHPYGVRVTFYIP